ncbi:hypothetical protein BB341_27160 [Streptomyces clavuligerus]|nr:hypothetical protein BB341_27160 [Streptomyces clavuligerus]AXU16257.1 hypothetical protein D1794_28225 [Streptomyces clavuligerus]QCS09036.1 hypothetical protein CRV15_27580 [Streptomyces clavuligerus]
MRDAAGPAAGGGGEGGTGLEDLDDMVGTVPGELAGNHPSFWAVDRINGRSTGARPAVGIAP